MTIVLKLAATKGATPKRGFRHYWSVMMDLEMEGKPFTLQTIFDASSANRDDIREFIKRLEMGGFIVQCDASSTEEHRAFRVVTRQSATPRVRRDGTVVESAGKQQCMWNAMRSPAYALGFTALDLIAWTPDDVPISKDSARNYIQMLARAGYLLMVDKGAPGKLATWRLAPDMNTGPLPPMILKTKIVFDQNRHQVIGEAIAEEERV